MRGSCFAFELGLGTAGPCARPVRGLAFSGASASGIGGGGPARVSPVHAKLAREALKIARSPDACACRESVGERVSAALETVGVRAEDLRTLLEHAGVSGARTAQPRDLPHMLGAENIAKAIGTTPGRLLSGAGVHVSEALGTGLLRGPVTTRAAELGEVGEDDDGELGDYVPYPPEPGGVPGAPPIGTPATPDKKAPNMPGGFPAPPGFRPGNWDFERSTYVLASGDTLSGLARLYLPGEPPRWREITALNPGKNPDSIPVGTVLNMPLEARDRAKALIPSTPSVPSTIGRSVPGAIGAGAGDKNLPPAPGAPMSTGKKLAIAGAAVGGVALIGGIIYAATG